MDHTQVLIQESFNRDLQGFLALAQLVSGEWCGIVCESSVNDWGNVWGLSVNDWGNVVSGVAHALSSSAQRGRGRGALLRDGGGSLGGPRPGAVPALGFG